MTSPAALAGVRVVVLDDDDDARDLAATVLGSAGARVRRVSSVDELWQMFDDFCPHVVVSDISMPGLSGLDMVKALRARRSEDGGYTSLVAVTGLALEEQRARGLKAGFDRYLTKPFAPSDLVDAVAALSASR